jgi:hypothetical protein
MAEPVLSLALLADTGVAKNLTNLTSDTSVDYWLRGDSGGDWIYPYANGYTPVGDYYFAGVSSLMQGKLNGGERIQMTTFTPSGEDENVFMQSPHTMSPGLFIEGYDCRVASSDVSSSTAFRCVMLGSQIPCGLVFRIPANQNLNRFTWYGQVNTATGAGNFNVTATLADGSVAPQTLALTKNTSASFFTCDFRCGPDADSELEIKVQLYQTPGAGSEDYAFIGMLAATLDVAIPPARSRGIKRYFQQIGRSGGAL